MTDKSSASPATDGEGTPLEQINPGEAVDLCGRLEAGHRIASATAYHRAAAWERLARALAKRFDAIGTEQESIWRLRAEEVGALGSQSLVSEIADSPAAKNEGNAALRLLAEVADAMDLSLGDSVSVAKMRPLVLARLESVPSAIGSIRGWRLFSIGQIDGVGPVVGCELQHIGHSSVSEGPEFVRMVKEGK